MLDCCETTGGAPAAECGRPCCVRATALAASLSDSAAIQRLQAWHGLSKATMAALKDVIQQRMGVLGVRIVAQL